jgi:alcohol dehydrogenase class IV
MLPFEYNALQSRVIFGAGTVDRLPGELMRLGCSRAFILSTSGQKALAAAVAATAGAMAAGLFHGAVMHTPVEVTERTLSLVRQAKADCIVAVGGGSAIGLAKAIALRTNLPQIVLPTTYAGSEATPIVGETAGGIKTTSRSPAVLPEVVLYDVALTFDLPVAISVTSGLNALAHAAEALYAPNRNPVTDMLASKAIRLFSKALPAITQAADDAGARSDALFAAWASGVCLGGTDMGLHHKLCHTLGGAFDLPHAALHSVLLPHTLAYNQDAAPTAMTSIAMALGAEDAVDGIYRLVRVLGAPLSLRSLGMPESGLALAGKLAVQNPYANPAEITEEGILSLLSRAFDGVPPQRPARSEKRHA